MERRMTESEDEGTWIILDAPGEDKPTREDLARLMQEQRAKHPGILILAYHRDAAGVWQLDEPKRGNCDQKH